MEFGLLGSSGMRVSRVGLGCGFRNQTDLRVMEAAIRRAIDRGVTLLDCSNFYGKTPDTPYGGASEIALGRAVAACRDDVVITSKVGEPIGPRPNDLGGSRMHVMREIDRSLRRLQTDHGRYLHHPLARPGHRPGRDGQRHARRHSSGQGPRLGHVHF